MDSTHFCCAITIILMIEIYLASASNTPRYPTWFYTDNLYSDNNSTLQCDCDCDAFCIVEDNKVLVGEGVCATAQEGQYYHGSCPFGHPVNRINRKFSKLPGDPDVLNEEMCGPFNRRGFLCGDCIDGFGPAVYSLDLKCANCSNLPVTLASAIYLLLDTFPTMLIFISLVIFNLNITSGPFLGYIMFSQVYIAWLKHNLYIYDYIQSHVSLPLRVLFKVELTLCQFWSLQSFQAVIPPFCISEKMTGIDVQILKFLPAVYPVILVIITCILMELHARNCRIIHILWKPFSIILNKTNTTAVTGDAVIQAFASFILLSYVNIATTFGNFVSATNVYRCDCSIFKDVLFIDPNTVWLGQKHIIYSVMLFVPAIFLTLIPSVVLTLYPTRIYSRYISRCLSARKRLAITTFAEALHSCLKDGLNGTRDYRSLIGMVFTVFPILYIISRRVIFAFGFSIGVSGITNIVLLLFFVAYVQPCKHSVANFSISFHVFLLFLLCLGNYLWTAPTPTKTLELTFILLPLFSHIMILLWCGYVFIRWMKTRFLHWLTPAEYSMSLKDLAEHVKQSFCRRSTGYNALQQIQ